jgi:hypothetical protein
MMTFDLDEITEAIMDGTIGYCTNCGEEASGVEPDARKYECEICNKKTVYGAEELLIMGLAK